MNERITVELAEDIVRDELRKAMELLDTTSNTNRTAAYTSALRIVRELGTDSSVNDQIHAARHVGDHDGRRAVYSAAVEVFRVAVSHIVKRLKKEANEDRYPKES